MRSNKSRVVSHKPVNITPHSSSKLDAEFYFWSGESVLEPQAKATSETARPRDVGPSFRQGLHSLGSSKQQSCDGKPLTKGRPQITTFTNRSPNQVWIPTVCQANTYCVPGFQSTGSENMRALRKMCRLSGRQAPGVRDGTKFQLQKIKCRKHHRTWKPLGFGPRRRLGL